MRAHTNLSLEAKLEEWEAAVMPWEIEMVPEDPDDESDSE